MKNTSELRDEMVQLVSDLREKKVDVQTAKAIVGSTNLVLKSASLELDQNKYLGIRKPIDFLTTV